MEPLKPRLKKLIKAHCRDLWWHLYGSTIKRPLLPPKVESMLFLCKGNICRSPFAEYKAREIGKTNGMPHLYYASAGLQVKKQETPPAEAIEAAKKFGVYMDGHRSTALTTKMIGSFDMILVVEASQLRQLCGEYPEFAEKLFLLPFFDNPIKNFKNGFDAYNIEDPFGKTLYNFITCYGRIENCLNNLFSEIISVTKTNI